MDSVVDYVMDVHWTCTSLEIIGTRELVKAVRDMNIWWTQLALFSFFRQYEILVRQLRIWIVYFLKIILIAMQKQTFLLKIILS